MAARPRCPGHGRHWYTAGVYQRLPFCSRCLAPNPTRLGTYEMDEAEDLCRRIPRFSHGFVAAVGIDEGAELREVQAAAGDKHRFERETDPILRPDGQC